MKIGVISDTHGNIKGLKEVIKYLTEKEKISLCFHLGDDYKDVDILIKEIENIEKIKYEIIRVPGVYDAEYTDPSIPKRQIRQIEQIKILAAHTQTRHKNDPQDLPSPEELIQREKINLFLFGHTHIYTIMFKKIGEAQVLFLNPGHLKSEEDKSHPASFATIVINNQQIIPKIIEAQTKHTLLEGNFYIEERR